MEVVEKLRKELHRCIDIYGLSDKRTVDKSQELDKVLNQLEIL